MKKKVNKYNNKEKEYLRMIGYTDADVAMMTGRTEEAIRMKRHAMKYPEKIRETRRKVKENIRKAESERLGGRKYDYWSKAEIKMIMTSKKTDAELSEILGRTTNSIQKKRHRCMKEQQNDGRVSSNNNTRSNSKGGKRKTK